MEVVFLGPAAGERGLCAVQVMIMDHFTCHLPLLTPDLDLEGECR